MRQVLKIAFVLSTVFIAPRRAHAQTPPPLQQADTLAADLFARSNSTGMVLVVVRNHEVFFGSYGETAPGSMQRPTQDSLLRLCSLSKIFASDLLTKLTQDGTLTLDDPLQRFAPPGITVPAFKAHPITLKDLATHTSGLPREVGRAPRDMPHFTFPDYAYRWRWLPRQHLKTTPGAAALYSNIGFDLLGDALQSAAARPYAQLLAERTTTPLGLRETGFTPTAAQCARLLQGARDQGPCTDTQSSAGSSGLYSTATDMTAWLKYLLGTTTPALPAQPPAAEAVYIDPHTLTSQQGLDHAGAPSGIGLGWMHLFADDDSSSIIEKTGGGAGFTTYIALNQPRHIGLFVAFTDGGPPSPHTPHINVFKEANNLLLALIGLPPIPPDPPRPALHRTHPKPRKRAAHR